MEGLVSSVKAGGVHQPALVRPRDGGGYEIIAGHRRQRASKLAGYKNMPCIVRSMTDDEAVLAMTDDNLRHRETILPSEKAAALQQQYAAIVSQGVTNFRILFSTYILLGFMLMVITMMQAMGKASKASILVMLRQIVLFIPLVIFLPKLGGLGVTGVFAGPPLTDLVVIVLTIIMLISEFSSLSKLTTQKK